jgi:hypothetical protein
VDGYSSEILDRRATTAARTMDGSTKSAREAALEGRIAELEKQLQAREDFLSPQDRRRC